ncbi:MAG: outer membrane protein assembly factor BamD [Candidatus Omnitrophica bacterium]|nr:outer membrane protein assembly factor BamD [Candidatus Omnitrophota bacterium]
MKFRRFLLTLFFSLTCLTQAHAVWIWTPQTGKFINPKWAVKSTPKEQLEYGLAFLEGKKYKEAIAEFKKLIKFYPRSKEAPEAQYYMGKTQETLSKPYEAFKVYQVVIDKYPFSERAAEIVDIEYQIGNQLLEGRNKKGKIVEVFIGGDDRVIDVFRTVIKNAPYGKYSAISQYKIGLYLKEKGLYDEARDEFEKTVNDYPTSEWAKAAQFQIAMADTKRSANPQHEQKTTQLAIEGFKEFVKSHPESELTPEAKNQISRLRNKESENSFVIAQFYERQKNYKSARIYYNDIINKYADTVWAPKALMRLKIIGDR